MGEFHCMYSRSHCLTKMPKSAAARLSTRLMKKRILIHRAEVEGTNTVEDKMTETVSLNEAGDCWERSA